MIVKQIKQSRYYLTESYYFELKDIIKRKND